MNDYPYTKEEWEACLKVMEYLAVDPLNNPDNQRFKTLVTQITKKAKKEINKLKDIEETKESVQWISRKERLKKEDDDAVNKTVIIANAHNITTEYAHRDTAESEYKKLNYSKQCYCCHTAFNELHFFYHRLCPNCASLNYANRKRSFDFTGYQVIVTGARVKIGFATVLKFLRNGATVLATTRFPAVAWEQYAQEKDFKDWESRLTIYGLDLRSLKAVYSFTEYCKTELSQVDILINNAAQTIKYTSEYYTPILKNEQNFLVIHKNDKLVANETPLAAKQQALLEVKESKFIPLNRFGQPVDAREKTSWNSTLDEINIEELLEVNLINQISPYLLISELKSMMVKSKNLKRFVINVTSSEGQFSYLNKTVHHPHTNMTKAALNMLTRTSAADFISDGIYMNAVDVGWISTGAHEEKRKRLFDENKVPPLDSVDGAMRIMMSACDVLEEKNDHHGVLLKDYKPVDW